MFCFQCQETLNNSGCTVKGVCGKSDTVANLQDILIYTLKGISFYLNESGSNEDLKKNGPFIIRALFSTITNANFDETAIKEYIKEALSIRKSLSNQLKGNFKSSLPDAAIWDANNEAEFMEKAYEVSILKEKNEDIRSLKELLIYGIKGLSAYAEHAYILGYEEIEIYKFIVKALSSTLMDLTVDELLPLINSCGLCAVKAMEILDRANTETFGNPEITKVNIGVGERSGILISGHDLKDLHELLEQTKNENIDIYTHCEMLPAHYYPAFKKYKHLKGNYGSAWWNQSKEFEAFNGPILLTTNCITPVRDSYKDRFFTTGAAGYPGTKHIPDRTDGKPKDFSQIIALAKKCKAPTPIEEGYITGGFAHNQVLALADTVVEAVKSGGIKRFVVMAGCDGRQKSREYYTEVAKNLPEDTVILTAGCAKFRYNKLNLCEIGGIPRVLDAGQCNDSYSLALIALKLKEVFGLDDINKLPISYDIAWYEQKAVCVLLALLSLGVKGIRLGPTLPGFLSKNVAEVLIKNYNLKPITDAFTDINSMLQGV
jgi:hydroxylamine reductase